MRPEELLVAALRDKVGVWPSGAGPAFESAVLDAAADHGVAALLASAPAVTQWPSSLQLALRNVRRDEAAIEAIRRQDLLQLLAEFRQAGVRCLLIKGAQLAYTHYAQPWLRPRFDTDLLVAPADRERADAALRSLGYARSNQVSGTLVTHQLQYARPDRYGLTDVVDLHWKVTNPHVFAGTLVFDELAAAATPLPALGPGLCGLSNVDALMLACVHRVAHHQNSDRLIWLYDIHLLVNALPPAARAELFERARAKGLRAVCAAGLTRAQLRFGTVESSGWLALWAQGSEDQTEPAAAFLRDGLRRIDILRSDVRALRGWRQKTRLIAEHLFPPAAYVRERYGRNTVLFLLFAYVARILSGVGKWFRVPS